jgi:hypothetical protein
MICIIAPDKLYGENWARGQMLAKNEYFVATEIDHLISYTGFHVLVIGIFNGWDETYFNKLLAAAQSRGMRGRK